MYKLSKTISFILAITVLLATMSGVNAEEEKQRNNPFTDTYDEWYESSVNYAYEKSLISGFDDGTFKPDATISRAEFSVILERLFNRETYEVSDGEWYSEAELWIKANNIMAEIMQNDEFLPDNSLTREELAVMLYNSYKLSNTASQTDVKLEEFEDGSEVSEYAQEAVKWFISNGIIKGDDNNKINPADNITRGEVTAVMQRFINNTGGIVSIDSVNGDEVKSFYVSKGTKIKKTDNPTRAKLIFDNWYSGDEVWDFETPVNEDVSIVAKWTADENTFAINPDAAKRAEGSDVRIMSFNVKTETSDNKIPVTGGRSQHAADTILRYAPDVISLQENTDIWYEELGSMLANYKYVNEDNKNITGALNCSPIVYNTETVKLVEYGQQRYKNWDNIKCRTFTWALFVPKSNVLKMFMVTSTHWDLEQKNRIKQAKEMAELIESIKDSYGLKDIAVFSVGDYNSNEGTTEYKTLVAKTGFKSAKYTANEKGLVCKTFHRGDGGGDKKDYKSSYYLLGSVSFRDNNMETIKTIDHILTSSSVEPLYYDTVVDEDTLNASDHCPIYVDAKMSSCVYETSSVNVGEWIGDTDNWFSNTDEFTNGKQLILKKAEMAAYMGEKLIPNQMLRFRANFDLANWEGLAYSIEDNNDFRNVTGYSLVLKKGVIEVQRRLMNGGKLTTKLIEKIPNDESIINTGDWYDIETGILYSEKGPRIVLKANGKTIVDYTDESEYAIYKIGHFQFYNASDVDALYVEAAAN